jgi:hypothetical protein
MLKLKTKTQFKVPTKRGVILSIVRLIIDKIELDDNNINAIGYYYYIDENYEVVKLDNVNSFNLWETILSVEQNLLNPLNSSLSLKANILQRLNEFTMLQLTTESGENYGTTPDDWEQDLQEETPIV